MPDGTAAELEHARPRFQLGERGQLCEHLRRVAGSRAVVELRRFVERLAERLGFLGAYVPASAFVNPVRPRHLGKPNAP